MTLTREEIQAQPPGRELDALIAEHVMGLDMVEGQLPQLPRYYLTDYEKTIHRDVPLYSSEISAAWEVEERIKELRLHTNYVAALKWVLINTGEYVGMFDYIHATAEQRCKAALLAVLEL